MGVLLIAVIPQYRASHLQQCRKTIEQSLEAPFVLLYEHVVRVFQYLESFRLANEHRDDDESTCTSCLYLQKFTWKAKTL